MSWKGGSSATGPFRQTQRLCYRRALAFGDTDRSMRSATEVALANSPLSRARAVSPENRPGTRPVRSMRTMSRLHSTRKTAGMGRRVSTLEILTCFEDQQEALLQLALLIAGDMEVAERSVSSACEMAIHRANPLPFREQLTEWVTWVAIKAAISNTLYEIGPCELRYVNQTCNHSAHLLNGNDSKLQEFHNFLLHVDPETFITGLDALARAVAILRATVRASILDCTLRLNMSPDILLAANCRAMTWLAENRNRSNGKVDSRTTKVVNLV